MQLNITCNNKAPYPKPQQQIIPKQLSSVSHHGSSSSLLFKPIEHNFLVFNPQLPTQPVTSLQQHHHQMREQENRQTTVPVGEEKTEVKTQRTFII